MTETHDWNSGGWYLVLIAAVADVLGVLTFIGVRSDERLRLALAGVLSLLGVVVAGITLITGVRLWLSPRGSYYPQAFHLRRVGTGLGAAGIAVALAIFVMIAVVNVRICHGTRRRRWRASAASL